MKKTNRKGFTIVELVIVIAVIAILAAVLIPVFSNVIKKANQSSDTQLVRNLNTAVSTGLASEGKTKCSTAHQAIEYAKDGGYDVAKIVAKSDNKISWSKDTGLFVLIDTNTGKAIYPTQNGVGELVVSGNEVNYFLICSSMPTSTSYSIYAGINWAGEKVTLNGIGFDAGDNTDAIKTVTYTNTSAKDVIIRTNGGTLEITDTNASSHQYHYGFASNVTVKTGTNCYECHAVITNMTITEGKAIADEGAFVGVVKATEGVTLKEINGGIFAIPEYAKAEDINAGVAAQIDYTISGGKITPSAAREKKATEAYETANKKLNEEVGKNKSYVARIGTKGYSDLQDAFDAAVDSDTVYLLKSININNSDFEIVDKNITIDGFNNTITISCDSEYAETQDLYTYGIKIIGNTKNIRVDIKDLTISAVGSVRYALCYNGDDDGYYCASGNVYNCKVSCSYVGLGVSGNDYGDSDVQLYDCEISHVAPDVTENTWLNCAVAPQFDGRVTINGGTYTSTKYCVYIYSTGGIATINGGSFTATTAIKAQCSASWSQVHAKAEIFINGGTVNGNVEKSGNSEEYITIKGGTYTVDPTAYVDTTKYEVKKQGDIWTVTAK